MSKLDLIDELSQNVANDSVYEDYQKKQIAAIANRYLEVNENEHFSAMILNKNIDKGDYLKVTNVLFKFRESLDDIFAVVKDGVAINITQKNTFKNILLVIDIIKHLLKMSDIKLSESECKVIYALYKLDNAGMFFNIDTIVRTVADNNISKIEIDNVSEAIAHLVEIGCIEKKDSEDIYKLNDFVIIR